MWDLLKEYLELSDNYSYQNVNVIDLIYNGHFCVVSFRHSNSTGIEKISLNVWDVLSYVNSKK